MSDEDRQADRVALAIYACMSHDVCDALEMIAECTSVRTMDTLRKMLVHKGTEKTDVELNKIMLGPVMRRLDALRAAR